MLGVLSSVVTSTMNHYGDEPPRSRAFERSEVLEINLTWL